MDAFGTWSCFDFVDEINADMFRIDFKNKKIVLNLAILRVINAKLDFKKFVPDTIMYCVYIMWKTLIEYINKNFEFELKFVVGENNENKTNS